MLSLRTALVFVVGGAIIVLVSVFSPVVTFKMGMVAGAFLLLGQVSVDMSKGSEQVGNQLSFMIWSGLAMLLLVGNNNADRCWLMLNYGAPMLAGLLIPMTAFRLSQQLEKIVEEDLAS